MQQLYAPPQLWMRILKHVFCYDVKITKLYNFLQYAINFCQVPVSSIQLLFKMFKNPFLPYKQTESK